MIRIIGNYVSPYVRKVLVALEMKGVAYEIDPITPFLGNEAFEAISPLRRIPVLIDKGLTLCDSTVICEYLEEAYPAPALLPASPADRARARWLEEFADTRLGDLLIWRLFFQKAVGPRVLGRETDEAVVSRTTETDLPAAMDYLERQAPAKGFLFGESASIADIAVACPFKNGAMVRWRPDAERWPNATAWVARTLALPAFKTLEPLETLMLRTPPAEQRAVLAAVGVNVAAESFAGVEVRPGVMPI